MNREDIVALRQRLLDRGYQPVPVYNWDYDKVPEKSRGKVPFGTDWQKTSGIPRYRSCAQNTGILTGAPPRPLDVVVDDPADAAEVVQFAVKRFGETVIRGRTISPRRLLVYRSEDGEARKIVI